jgi:hypothetical protein
VTKLAKAAGLAGILVLLSAVTAWRPQAAEPGGALGEGQAAVTDLDPNSSAITYWVDEPDGWHVVTTVDVVFDRDGDAERHAIVRFSAVLQPGQSQQISIPTAIGKQTPVLRIRRLGDRIEVALVPGSAV